MLSILFTKIFSGDGNGKTQVAAIDLVDSMNKAGVMFREDLSADARFVFMGITSSKKVVFISRNQRCNATAVTDNGVLVPYYVRM
jgi:hypothetical protein